MHEIEILSENSLSFVAEAEKGFSDAWSLSSLSSFLSTGSGIGFILKEDGIPVSYALFNISFDEAELLRILTVPKKRRCGFGEKLLRDSIRCLCGKKIKNIFLEVRSLNGGAVSLYEKLGFSRIGMRKGYYSSPKDDALIYKLDTEAYK